MPELKLKQKLSDTLNDFVKSLQGVYNDDLISVILYGSASSGEFVDKHSNLNLLVVLKNNGLQNLKKATGLANKWRFRLIHPLFFSQDYMKKSNDVFPIEFLDMKENYTVLSGIDTLKDISIDTKNLRFQCEHELRAKLISLRQLYLRKNKDKLILSSALFKSFNSILHISRNLLRIKGKATPYLKQDIIKAIVSEFQINKDSWEKIRAAKNQEIKLSLDELDKLFVIFVEDLEKIIGIEDNNRSSILSQGEGERGKGETTDNKRSVGVTILGIFLLLCTILSFVAALIGVISPGFSASKSSLVLALDFILRILIILIPFVVLLAAIGMFRLKNWARLITMFLSPVLSFIVFGISGIFLDVMVPPKIVSLIIPLGTVIMSISLIYYLTRPKVKEQFT